MTYIYTIFLTFVIGFFHSLTAQECPFCTQKVIVPQRVLETSYFYVLVDYAPRVPGHLLAVTKRHIGKAHEMSQNEWGDLYEVIRKVVPAFSCLFQTDNYIILEKNGPKAFQQIPHVHFHLLPMSGQTPDEVFGRDPRCLLENELQDRVSIFKKYFQGGN